MKWSEHPIAVVLLQLLLLLLLLLLLMLLLLHYYPVLKPAVCHLHNVIKAWLFGYGLVLTPVHCTDCAVSNYHLLKEAC